MHVVLFVVYSCIKPAAEFNAYSTGVLNDSGSPDCHLYEPVIASKKNLQVEGYTYSKCGAYGVPNQITNIYENYSWKLKDKTVVYYLL